MLNKLVNQFNLLTENIFDRQTLLGISKRYLAQATEINDKAAIYFFSAKVAVQKYYLKRTSMAVAVEHYQQLQAFAQQHGDVLLEVIALTKIACCAGAIKKASLTQILGYPVTSLQTLKKTLYTQALSLVLQTNLTTPILALNVAARTKQPGDASEAFIGPALGLANTFDDVTMLDTSYTVMQNIIAQNPQHMTTQVCAFHNRIAKYLDDKNMQTLTAAKNHLTAIKEYQPNKALMDFADEMLDILNKFTNKQLSISQFCNIFLTCKFHPATHHNAAFHRNLSLDSYREKIKSPVSVTKAHLYQKSPAKNLEETTSIVEQDVAVNQAFSAA